MVKIGKPMSDPMPGTAPPTRAPISTAVSTESHPRPGTIEAHSRAVFDSIIEKTLVNLHVLSRIQTGDKLALTQDGCFYIHKPGRLVFLQRMATFTSRWSTLNQLQTLFASAELVHHFKSPTERARIKDAIVKSVHGMRNLQKTYELDGLYYAHLDVLITRIGLEYQIPPDELV